MTTLRLGAKAEGTKSGSPASLQKNEFLGFTPMSRDALEKKAWLLLQANSECGRLSPEAKAVLESLNGVAARLQLQLNAAYAAGYSPAERIRMENMLSIYQGTFEQLRIYEQAFASLCGPREILAQESADVKFNAEQQLKKAGLAGFLEKNVLPWAVGLLTGGAAAASGFASWAAARLAGLIGAAGPAFQQNAAAFIGFALAASAIGLVAKAAIHRTHAIEKRRIASLKAIGGSEQEIMRAIVRLVVLEYQRLATKNGIKVGAPVESEETIHRKMEQQVFEVKSKHGFDLPLPSEVERAIWPLLHRKRTSFLEKAALSLRARLETLFRGLGGQNGAQPGPYFEPRAGCLNAYDLCAVA
ncbi:MAG: hypothetical protein WC861_00680 [Candidatus Micrarchaeia archaeon]|jgi:hypothetical protein